MNRASINQLRTVSPVQRSRMEVLPVGEVIIVRSVFAFISPFSRLHRSVEWESWTSRPGWFGHFNPILLM
jgi:hypothetical protein